MLDPVEALRRSAQNLGEMPDADVVGTVGNPACGEMLRLWVKFRSEAGRRVIDRATFQSFGCETAIAVASLATELIRGKTAEEALALRTEQLAGELGPLPPLKIHCAELVEGALRSALEPAASPSSAGGPGGVSASAVGPASIPADGASTGPAVAGTLADSLAQARGAGSPRRVVLLTEVGTAAPAATKGPVSTPAEGRPPRDATETE